MVTHQYAYACSCRILNNILSLFQSPDQGISTTVVEPRGTFQNYTISIKIESITKMYTASVGKPVCSQVPVRRTSCPSKFARNLRPCLYPSTRGAFHKVFAGEEAGMYHLLPVNILLDSCLTSKLSAVLAP